MARSQVNWKFFAHFFTPPFYCIKCKTLNRIIIPENILKILCAVFKIFQFEIFAISLYGNGTTKYGILWKLWCQLPQKPNKEISWNVHRDCNSPRSFDFQYKTHRLPNWELPDYWLITVKNWNFKNNWDGLFSTIAKNIFYDMKRILQLLLFSKNIKSFT